MPQYTNLPANQGWNVVMNGRMIPAVYAGELRLGRGESVMEVLG